MEKVAKTLGGANDHLRAAAMVLRNICIGLYPPFRDQGIQVTVEAITQDFKEKHGLHINLAVENRPQFTSMPENDAMTIAVSRVLTEALNNVVKHAPQSTVYVQLRAGAENLYLSIADDGPGNGTLNLSLSELVRRGHLGIVGMHECARFAGGSVCVDKNEPSGTQIILTCPLNV
jgi:signal transduction histidine kinase